MILCGGPGADDPPRVRPTSVTTRTLTMDCQMREELEDELHRGLSTRQIRQSPNQNAKEPQYPEPCQQTTQRSKLISQPTKTILHLGT